MSILLEGAEGTVQVGPTNHLTEVGFVSEFEVECKTDVNQKGPYIGNKTIYKNRKAKTSSGTLSGDIPEGRDPGQTKLVEAHEEGLDIRLELIADNGYTYVAEQAIVSGVKFGGNAEEGYTFEFSFEDGNGYTLEPTA